MAKPRKEYTPPPPKPRKEYTPPPPKPAPKPVEVGQIVYVSVLPKPDIAGNYSNSSPKLFATKEAAQADCDRLNKGRMPSSQFVVRTMTIEE